MSPVALFAALIFAAFALNANTPPPVAPQMDKFQHEAVRHKPKPPVVNTIQVQGVPGADVSEYDDPIDWPKLALAKQFVIIRASHGLHHDVTFLAYWAEAKQLGLLVGAYHYVDPTLPFADQLRYYVKTVRLEKGDLYPILDLEEYRLWKHMPAANRIKYILKWAEALEHVYGVKPIIYLSPAFVQDIVGLPEAAALKDFPLWVAHYHVPTPWVPLPWTSFIIWQWAETGSCPGVKTACDLDVAPGSLDDLKRYTMDHAAGGDDAVLSAADLDDGGLTALVPQGEHEDHQHGRPHHSRHWKPHIKNHYRHAIVSEHRRTRHHGRRR